MRRGSPKRAATVFVVLGPAGAGKSTVAAALAKRLGCAAIDADALHAPTAVAHISAGEPLTEAERAPWLERVAGVIDTYIAQREQAVVACSALRRGYRDTLRRPEVEFIYLDVPPTVLEARLNARTDHIAHADLLPSQLATFEPLEPDEHALTVDGTLPPAEVVDSLVAGLLLSA